MQESETKRFENLVIEAYRDSSGYAVDWVKPAKLVLPRYGNSIEVLAAEDQFYGVFYNNSVYYQEQLQEAYLDVRTMLRNTGGISVPIVQKLASLGINADISSDKLSQIWAVFSEGGFRGKANDPKKQVSSWEETLKSGTFLGYPYCSPSVDSVDNVFEFTELYAEPEKSLYASVDPVVEAPRKIVVFKATGHSVPNNAKTPVGPPLLDEYTSQEVDLSVLLRQSGIRPLLRWYIQYVILSLVESKYGQYKDHPYFAGMGPDDFQRLKNEIEESMLDYRDKSRTLTVCDDLGDERGDLQGNSSTFEAFCQSVTPIFWNKTSLRNQLRFSTNIGRKVLGWLKLISGWYWFKISYRKIKRLCKNKVEDIQVRLYSISIRINPTGSGLCLWAVLPLTGLNAVPMIFWSYLAHLFLGFSPPMDARAWISRRLQAYNQALELNLGILSSVVALVGVTPVFIVFWAAALYDYCITVGEALLTVGSIAVETVDVVLEFCRAQISVWSNLPLLAFSMVWNLRNSNAPDDHHRVKSKVDGQLAYYVGVAAFICIVLAIDYYIVSSWKIVLGANCISGLATIIGLLPVCQQLLQILFQPLKHDIIVSYKSASKLMGKCANVAGRAFCKLSGAGLATIVGLLPVCQQLLQILLQPLKYDIVVSYQSASKFMGKCASVASRAFCKPSGDSRSACNISAAKST